jgi:nuclear transport factor 2 (NTF2) superfamily protein
MSPSDNSIAQVSATHIQRLQAMYEAFNARDSHRVLLEMTPDVDWPNGWEGGRVTGQQAVRDYWQRQWAAIDPQVTPVEFTALPDGRVQVRVHQVVRDRAGTLLADGYTHHVYAFDAMGLICSMEIVAA